jgi:hypothetical protein
MKKPSCENCIFFDKSSCRRYPPADCLLEISRNGMSFCINKTHDFFQIDGDGRINKPHAHFPFVTEYDWCGEFKSKRKGKT